MPQTLLLADDSATIQRVIELTFADEDIQVVAVSDGDQAIARLESAPPDIVLADIGMPGKNGYEVAEYIKQTPKLAHIPVVLLTGAFEPVDQEKANAIGCDGVLAKPFEPQIVIGRVRELLGRSAPASADAIAPATLRQVPEQQPQPAAVEDLFLAPPPPPAPVDAAAEPEPAPRVEDYFDRLDAAFSTLSNQRAATPFAAASPIAVEPPPPPSPIADELDRLVQQNDAPQDFAIADQLAAEVPAEPEPPAPEPPTLEPIKLVTSKPLEPLEPLESREPRSLPSIADAFAVILAAEQNALGVTPEWPTPSSAPTGTPTGGELVITDDLVDRVARRVLEQLSDQVVRETVASIASDVAERLVREEIERIKAAVKQKD